MAQQRKSAGDSAASGNATTTGTEGLAQAHDVRSAGAFSLIDPQVWQRQATTALIEAQAMNDSIHALVQLLIEDSDSKSFPLLEAIAACVQRSDAAVGPAVEAVQRVGGGHA